MANSVGKPSKNYSAKHASVADSNTKGYNRSLFNVDDEEVNHDELLEDRLLEQKQNSFDYQDINFLNH